MAALIAFAIVSGTAAWHLVVLGARAQALEAETRAAGLRASSSALAGSRSMEPGERLERFERVLGRRVEFDTHLQTVFAAARRSGVTLVEGDYRHSYNGAGQFFRYEATFPVGGRFAAIQRFSEVVLAELPFAALEDVSLWRT